MWSDVNRFPYDILPLQQQMQWSVMPMNGRRISMTSVRRTQPGMSCSPVVEQLGQEVSVGAIDMQPCREARNCQSVLVVFEVMYSFLFVVKSQFCK